MEIQFTEDWQSFFADEKGEKARRHLEEELRIFAERGNPHMKRVYTLEKSVYELKIKKGKDSFRIAFYAGKEWICFYVSATLYKKRFDREAAKAFSRWQFCDCDAARREE